MVLPLFSKLFGLARTNSLGPNQTLCGADLSVSALYAIWFQFYRKFSAERLFYLKFVVMTIFSLCPKISVFDGKPY